MEAIMNSFTALTKLLTKTNKQTITRKPTTDDKLACENTQTGKR
jgi:hypothetical protein